ncbi:Aste57867_13140 [Aphanomyces stellatus]|uniref:Aste57867_13140 protein n=1 Tax=Aphanomyces stellatus TaxID=120398 RepID=A0A485KXU0_9STRA|nr:hypothetical protein As57867_013091 [Aphanomyces stellatus]VFT89982.1 Aste57867_13140 [Aphanomyces stellatus]
MGDSVERAGTHRTAHIWKHFVKRRDLEKYFNNWRVECRHCREAYDARNETGADVAEPEIVISTTAKMKAHLRQCPFTDPTELDLLESPIKAEGVNGSKKRAFKPSRLSSLTAAMEMAADDDEASNQDASTTTHTSIAAASSYPAPPASVADASSTHADDDANAPTMPYNTAYVWAHFEKRLDLGKYHNNWYVECKHCRRAFDEAQHQHDVSTVEEPKVLISAMVKMKAHLKKCAHVPRADLAAFHETNKKMIPLKRRRFDKNQTKAIAIRSNQQELYWLALVATPVHVENDVVHITWLSKTTKGVYMVANDDAVPLSSILCEVMLAEMEKGEFTLAKPYVQKIHTALETPLGDLPRFDFTDKDYVKAEVADARITTASTAAPSTPAKATAFEGRRHPVWHHYSKRVDLGKYHTNWYVECNHCLAAHHADPDNVPRPPTMRSTIPNMQSHLESCPNQGLAGEIATTTLDDPFTKGPPPPPPSLSVVAKGGVPKSKKRRGATTTAMRGTGVVSAATDETAWRWLWHHFIKRVDIPRYYFFFQVECRHCRAAVQTHQTSDEPQLLISSPPMMRQHLRDCPWMADDDDADAYEALPLVGTLETNETQDDVLFGAMEFVAVRCEGGFWLAQLGYDVTVGMMDADHAAVEVTWLIEDQEEGRYVFSNDEDIPTQSILCPVAVKKEGGTATAPVVFLLLPEEAQRVRQLADATTPSSST